MALPLTEGILCYEIVAEELKQADSLSKDFVEAVHLLKSEQKIVILRKS